MFAVGAYAIEWGNGVFGALFEHQDTDSGMELWLQRFAPVD
jgi:hypothetical protein